MKTILTLLLGLATFLAFGQSQEPVLSVAQVMPEYPGGEKALAKFVIDNVKYPDFAMIYYTQGIVIAGFIVNEDGSISDIKIKQSVSKGIDKEVLRVISLFPKFRPGSQQGKQVKAPFTFSVKFEIIKDQSTVSLYVPDTALPPIILDSIVSEQLDAPIYRSVERMPYFPGGPEALADFIYDNMEYPLSSRNNDVHGIVKVGYVVNEDSTLSNFFIRRGVSKDLNNEALRLAKMIPKFIPGMIADQKVKVLMQVSIDFDIKMYERARFRANQQPGNHSYVPTKF